MPFPSLPKRHVPSEGEQENRAPTPAPVAGPVGPARTTPELVKPPAAAPQGSTPSHQAEVLCAQSAQKSSHQSLNDATGVTGGKTQVSGKTGAANSAESAPEEGSRWEWVRPLWSKFVNADAPVQFAMVGALVVPICLAVGFYDSSKMGSSANASDQRHVPSGFGPQGYPLVPVSERRVTDKDVASLLKHSASTLRPAAPSEGPTTSEPAQPIYVARDESPAVPRAADSAAGSHARARNAGKAVQAPPIVAPAKRRSARLYAPGGTLKGAPGDHTEGPTVPAGTRIEVVLEVGVSSAHRGTVMGRVEQDVVSPKGDVLIPAGALLRGSARPDVPTGRMFLDFTQLVRGDKSSRLQGYAVADGEAGIPAESYASNAHNKQKNALAGGSLDTVQDVASGLPALVRNIARRSTAEAKKDLTPNTSVTLSLPSQTRFEVFITG